MRERSRRSGPERRGRFGEVRAFGSLAFVVSTVAVGFLLDAEGARSLFWAYLPFLVATVLVTATIPRRGTATRSASILRGAGDFLATKGIALFLVGFTVVWASLAAVTAFYSIQVVALGGSPGLVGIAWAVGAAIEVPYMFAFPRIAGRFGTERLVVVGSLAFALRALLAALAVDPVALVLIAPLEGIGFASVFVGGVTVLAAHAPASLQGTAQGLFAGCAGLATIIGSFAGGEIAGALSIPGLFLVGAAASLAGTGIVAVALLGSRHRPDRATGPSRGRGLSRPGARTGRSADGSRTGAGNPAGPAVYGGRHRPVETVEDRHAPPSTDRIRSDGAGPRPGRRRERRGQGRRRHRDARRAAAARPGGRLDDHDRLVARPAAGRRNDTPVLGRGRLPAVHATGGQPRSTFPDGRIARAISPRRSLVPAGGLGEVAFGMRGDMCSRGTCVSSFEFFRVADTTAAEAAAAAAQARTQAGRAPAPGQRREAAVAPAPVAPVVRSSGEPDHADSSRPGAADGSLRRRRLAGRADGHRSCADRDRRRGARSRPDERGLTVRPSDGRPPTAPRPGGGAGGAAQSSRASSATSRTRSMKRYSQSSALISAILPASAGCVLISRSWSSDATW